MGRIPNNRMTPRHGNGRHVVRHFSPHKGGILRARLVAPLPRPTALLDDLIQPLQDKRHGLRVALLRSLDLAGDHVSLELAHCSFDGIGAAEIHDLCENPLCKCERPLVWVRFGRRTKPEDFILAGRKGTSGGQARMLKDHIKPACAALNLKPATWLTFRRSWNTWADGKGISPKMRGDIVANSAEINSAIYTKTIAETLRNAVELVGEALCANCAPRSEMVN